jgi:hypothetical protein
MRRQTSKRATNYMDIEMIVIKKIGKENEECPDKLLCAPGKKQHLVASLLM